MHGPASTDIRFSTDHMLVHEPLEHAVTWRSLPPTLKKLTGTIQLWCDMVPPQFVAPAALDLKGVHFDLLIADELGSVTTFKVCSYLTARLAGCSMLGRSITDAPNAHWVGSLLEQLRAVRYAQNLIYNVSRELVDNHLSSVHRLIIPLSLDGRVIDEYCVASQTTPAQ